MRHREARVLSCMYMLSLTLLVLIGVRGLGHTVAVSEIQIPATVVILDAGHGGADGGGVSKNGTTESEINLAIVQKADAVLGLLGQRTVLTRSTDGDLSDADADTISRKKVSDIRNRVKIINGQPDGVLVSIHQNIYPDASCQGAQVFYNGVPGGQVLAEMLQRNLTAQIDPSNHRQPKTIGDGVYLMKHSVVPSVLVECGFLSNAEDERNLKTETYQNKMSVVVAGTVFSFVTSSNSEI